MTRSIKILDSDIQLTDDFLDIYKLKFLPDNPRVFSCTHGEADFENLGEEEKQERIYRKLLEEPSVKNLTSEIKRHGGLMESILVRHDTMEVIEGNSRLAVYRKLHEQFPGDDWGFIQCDVVSTLTEEQQDAFLNQIHVKGKTQWAAYEKANFAYVRSDRGNSIEDIAYRFGETDNEIEKRIRIISMMKENGDTDRSHFSYYDVLVRNRKISSGIIENDKLREVVLEKIKQLAPEEDTEFTALELRNKLPVILSKPKVLKKYVRGEMTLDEGFQSAKISGARESVKQAQERLSNVTKEELRRLDSNEINALEPEIRRLGQEVQRIKGLVTELKGI